MIDDELAAFERTAGAAVERKQPADLADVLERVLDTGIVVAGEIRIDLLDIELLTIRLRLVITSIDKAEEVGLDWWRADPWYSASAERRSLRQRVRDSDDADDSRDEVGDAVGDAKERRQAIPVVDVSKDDRYEVVPDTRDPQTSAAARQTERSR